ncbi:MAG: hypothetical protein GXO19_00960, partial [Epsilonproteobacteria bacterium]|nr:hypothetical protein [Campylobacterota bacterium]NPA56283.1 hypothetical protein [Campylobacterota bacterium]
PLPNLTPLLQGEKVTFQKSYTGSALNPPQQTQQVELPPNPCEERVSQERDGRLYQATVRSSYTGEIGYDCSFKSREPWRLARPSIRIDQVVTTIAIDLVSQSKRVQGTISYNYREAKERFRGTYNGNYYDCSTIYGTTPVPRTLSSQDGRGLRWFFDMEWADPCTQQIVETSCPAEMVQCSGKYSSPATSQIHSLKLIFDYTITESSGRNHRVHIEKYLQ